MRWGKYKKAWNKYSVTKKEALEEKKLITTENKEKREKNEKIEAERKKKIETVARKSYFYPPNLMKAVYPPEKKESEKKESRDTDKERGADKRERKKVPGDHNKNKNREKKGNSGDKAPSSSLFSAQGTHLWRKRDRSSDNTSKSSSNKKGWIILLNISFIDP